MVTQLIGGAQQISNALVPKEGPVTLQALLDFTGGVTASAVDLTNQTLPGPNFKLSYVQGLYVDNSLGTVDLICIVGGTNQNIRFPAGTQTYAPIIARNPPTFVFAGKNNASPGITVPVFFLNVPLPALVMGQSALTGFSFSGSNLLVQDTTAENALGQLTALINSGGLNVNILSGGGSGGGFLGPLQWHTAALNAGSSSAILYTPAAGKKFYVNNMHVWLNPLSTGPTANFSWNIMDNNSGSIILGGDIFGLPSGAPTLTTAQGGIVLFNGDDLGWVSQTTNAPLYLQCNNFTNMFSAGGIVCTFSTLIGDHA